MFVQVLHLRTTSACFTTTYELCKALLASGDYYQSHIGSSTTECMLQCLLNWFLGVSELWRHWKNYVSVFFSWAYFFYLSRFFISYCLEVFLFVYFMKTVYLCSKAAVGYELKLYMISLPTYVDSGLCIRYAFVHMGVFA